MDSFAYISGESTITVSMARAVPEYDWGNSEDIEHESVITGKKSFVAMGDHATVQYTVNMWKLTSAEQTAIYGCRGKEGTLTTAVGAGAFRCTEIKRNYLDPIAGAYPVAILTFKSINYV